MRCLIRVARPIAFLLVTAGCVVALISAFEPELTGAWHLVAVYLIGGLIPYVVYGSLTDILDDCPLLISGVMLLAADLFARLYLGIHAAGQGGPWPAIILSSVLVLVVLPAAALLGSLCARLLAD